MSRPTDASTAQSALSITHCMDSPGAPVVISGYWTGPDVDDGCGSVEAMPRLSRSEAVLMVLYNSLQSVTNKTVFHRNSVSMT